ncbi:MAG: cytochrome c [Pseudomonadota bacterium]|nr:cytochrome c [Pseudomonadota bacterium]
MTTRRIKFLIGAALVGGTMTVGAGAQAYWGDPWGGPRSEPGYPYSGYGPGLDRTHERQSEMHDHKAAMQSVARMLSGRRTFDRAEAIGLAREIEASAGENLMRLFKPGDWRRSPLSRARIGDDLETFKAHAEALKEAAGELADELEKQPGAEDIRAGRAWSPDWRRSRRGLGMGDTYSRWRNEGGAVTKEVFDAYTKLRATCHGCHANFRSPWR